MGGEFAINQFIERGMRSRQNPIFKIRFVMQNHGQNQEGSQLN